MSLLPPAKMSLYEALAWACWRSRKAERMFRGPGGEELWAQVRAGKLPKGLGKPKHDPAKMEQEVLGAMRDGSLNYEVRRVKAPPPVDDMGPPMDPETAAKALESGKDLWIGLWSIPGFLGISEQRLLEYLRAGELVAYVTPGGVELVSTDHLLRFMVEHAAELPQRQKLDG